MKIALLQCNSVTGDVTGNMERILRGARAAAAAGASLCVTPELALCGVAPGQYLASGDLVQGCRRALDILSHELDAGLSLLVGAPVPSAYAAGLLSNAAVLVERGGWKVASRKVYRDQTLLRGAADPCDEDGSSFDRGISCGVVTLRGWRLGVVLCEKSWDGEGSFWQAVYAGGHSPLLELARRGVDALVHMTAAPFHIGAQEAAERLLSHVAARHHVHLFSVNLVGGNDSRVYHGQSVVMNPSGRLLSRGRAFAEDMLVVDTAAGREAEAEPEPLCACAEESCWHALTLGTRDFVRKCGASQVVIGLSGGMDSALVACVAVAALGADNVTGVLMPSPYSSEGAVKDSERLAANLGMRTVTLPITPLMQSFGATLAPGLALFAERPGDVTLENVQARIRGTLLMALANRAGALVLNTGNKSEIAMGYCTLYGDAVGALAVIGDLTKTRVYALARWYNAHMGGGIPEAIFAKAPSAELRPGQKDTDSLPPYDLLDSALDSVLAQGEGHDVPENLRAEVRRGLFRAEFKRRQLPPALVVSRTPFGMAWHAPIAGRLRLPDA